VIVGAIKRKQVSAKGEQAHSARVHGAAGWYFITTVKRVGRIARQVETERTEQEFNNKPGANRASRKKLGDL
jgi:hypothetical protein